MFLLGTKINKIIDKPTNNWKKNSNFATNYNKKHNL